MRQRIVSVRRKMDGLIPSRRYATHAVDSYPAKMLPHLARYAIEEVSEPGEVVFDPFCGCGTVMVESMVAGRHSLGADVNPVAVLLARSKSALYDTEMLKLSAAEVVREARRKVQDDYSCPTWLDYWFAPLTLRKLLALREAIKTRAGETAKPYTELLLTVLLLAVRRCSRADPRSPKPFISSAARMKRVGRHFDSFTIFLDTAREFAGASEDLAIHIQDPGVSVEVLLHDAREPFRHHRKGCADAVVTSPPYLSAQDYYRSSKLELAVLGLWSAQTPRRLGERIIGSGRGHIPRSGSPPLGREPRALKRLRDADERSACVVDKYLRDLSEVLRNVNAITRQGAKCCFILGDSTIQGIRLPVHAWVLELAESQGLHLVEHEVDAIRDRRVPPKRQGHQGLIEREHLLFFTSNGSASA